VKDNKKKTLRENNLCTLTSVVDLVSLNTDPAFQVNPDTKRIWIQAFDDRKLKKKKIQLKIFFNLFFYQKLWGTFCPPGSGSNPDPDPQHSPTLCSYLIVLPVP
jgi:hypothetical protein